MKEMYTFHKHHFSDRIHIDHCERNTSFLPEGDLDKERVRERMSDITSRRMHSKVLLPSY